jgi:hypothetical protein
MEINTIDFSDWPGADGLNVAYSNIIQIPTPLRCWYELWLCVQYILRTDIVDRILYIHILIVSDGHQTRGVCSRFLRVDRSVNEVNKPRDL